YCWGGPSHSFLYRVNKHTGAATTVGDTTFYASAMAFDTNNVLYGTSTNSLIKISTDTGAAILVSNISGTDGAALRPWALEIDTDGTMYAAVDYGLLYKINKSSGQAVLIGTMVSSCPCGYSYFVGGFSF